MMVTIRSASAVNRARTVQRHSSASRWYLAPDLVGPTFDAGVEANGENTVGKYQTHQKPDRQSQDKLAHFSLHQSRRSPADPNCVLSKGN
jgi:hypothetical protein